ncbi:MAG: hypothetical protein KME59_10515 [Trichormus sp. ATA11-4-KO1]|jgi:hypothetical protein|nr:hypothetical protein [Trichormus sp. ATA11-4-KO1]
MKSAELKVLGIAALIARAELKDQGYRPSPDKKIPLDFGRGFYHSAEVLPSSSCYPALSTETAY